MITIFTKGGYFIWPILICSIIALTVIIERFLTLQRKKFFPKDFINEVSSLIKTKSYEDIKVNCQKQNNILSRLIKTIINSKNQTKESIKTIVNEIGKREFELSERPLQVLSTIASISPLLGLLGTVSGMIKVFSVISVQGVGDPASLAAGINEALFTTVAGLVVAIPSFVFFKYYQSKLSVLAIITEEKINDFINLIKDNN
jgi:biopolymer transport protein ExbB